MRFQMDISDDVNVCFTFSCCCNSLLRRVRTALVSLFLRMAIWISLFCLGGNLKRDIYLFKCLCMYIYGHDGERFTPQQIKNKRFMLCLSTYGPLCGFGQRSSRVGRARRGRGTLAIRVELPSHRLLRGVALERS